MREDSISYLLTSTHLAEESNALTVLPIHIYHDFLYVVPQVSVSRRTLQCRVRHFTPTYVMTNELQKINTVSFLPLKISILYFVVV